jgi:hypothetical protein
MYLNNFAQTLNTRFKLTGSMDDLNHAVKVADTAVGATPKDRPARAGTYTALDIGLATDMPELPQPTILNVACPVLWKAGIVIADPLLFAFA